MPDDRDLLDRLNKPKRQPPARKRPTRSRQKSASRPSKPKPKSKPSKKVKDFKIPSAKEVEAVNHESIERAKEASQAFVFLQGEFMEKAAKFVTFSDAIKAFHAVNAKIVGKMREIYADTPKKIQDWACWQYKGKLALYFIELLEMNKDMLDRKFD